jgi:hypothetical protein
MCGKQLCGMSAGSKAESGGGVFNFDACFEMLYLAAHAHILQSALCIIDGIDAWRI